MLAQELRNKLREMLMKDPAKAIEEIKKEPKILEILINSDEERIKYIKMNAELEELLRRKANELRTTQGWLLGAGILLFLLLLDQR